MMNPFLEQMMAQIQGTNALQPGFDAGAGAPATGTAAGNPIKDAAGGLGELLTGISAPAGVKPQFSGGVSGTSAPFKTQVTDLISPILAQFQGAQNLGNVPTLGALINQAGR